MMLQPSTLPTTSLFRPARLESLPVSYTLPSLRIVAWHKRTSPSYLNYLPLMRGYPWKRHQFCRGVRQAALEELEQIAAAPPALHHFSDSNAWWKALHAWFILCGDLQRELQTGRIHTFKHRHPVREEQSA